MRPSLAGAAGLAVALAVAAVLAASGCARRPAEGRRCAATADSTCLDARTALVCVDGIYTRATCEGARGCAATRDGVSCDDTAAEAGAVCVTAGTAACSADKSAQLLCTGHHFAVASSCRGPGGCSVAADHRLTCDTTRADVGDTCDQETRYACARDGKAQLRCKDHRFALVNTCMGPGRCQAKPDETSFDCDDDLASVDDPCEDEGDLACSLDHQARLRCVKGHFADDGSCHSPGHCIMRIEKDLKHFACD